LTVQKESNVELEVEPKKCIKVGLDCSKEEKKMIFQIYHELSKAIA